METLTDYSFSSRICPPKHGIRSLSSIFFIFVTLSLLLSPAVPRAAAQSNQVNDGYSYKNFTPSMAVIIVVLVGALFFVGFFAIYFRNCNDSAAGNSIRAALSMRRAAARGLDAAVIETFPTFSYAEVKDHKIGKGALECAVCLNEFEDDETLRLIPKCDHVFHPECIDAWLESHVTCPVCRANLTPQPGDVTVQIPVILPQPAAEPAQDDDVSIHIDAVSDQQSQPQPQPQSQQEGREENTIKSKSVNRPNLTFNVPNRLPKSFSIKRPKVFSRFRSHSTGHSLVLPGENLDRYTLRLPEEVRKEVLNRAYLNRAKSVSVHHFPRDASSRRGFRTGEGSSRAGRSYRRMDRVEGESKSDRWGFSIFARWPSMKSPKVVSDNHNGGDDSSSASGKKTVRMLSFRNLGEPKKGDEIGLVSSDSAIPPV
ncbi:unnamed protein product [Cuscuta epithymum]|uniref:RING-type E3 ubiquitin transferase n=1 Tax=Cuscuta epithymum TaxID=186058 RepID=A0AAV0GB55_9ASTE|nr:unnamed protein product [Cuscuta epithymum]